MQCVITLPLCCCYYFSDYYMFSCCTGVRVVDVTSFRGCEEILASFYNGCHRESHFNVFDTVIVVNICLYINRCVVLIVH